MVDWWRRVFKPTHSMAATEELSGQMSSHVQEVKDKRQALEKLLTEVQEKRKANGH